MDDTTLPADAAPAEHVPAEHPAAEPAPVEAAPEAPANHFDVPPLVAAEVRAMEPAVDALIDDAEHVVEAEVVQLTGACKSWIRRELELALTGHSEETRAAVNP